MQRVASSHRDIHFSLTLAYSDVWCYHRYGIIFDVLPPVADTVSKHRAAFFHQELSISAFQGNRFVPFRQGESSGDSPSSAVIQPAEMHAGEGVMILSATVTTARCLTSTFWNNMTDYFNGFERMACTLQHTLKPPTGPCLTFTRLEVNSNDHLARK